MRMRSAPWVAAAVAVVALASAASAGAATAPKVVASGLDNPRGLAFGPFGRLFVAEAGRGGSGPCQTGPEGGSTCFGTSGAVTRINLRSGHQTRIASGLPSLGDQGTGAGALGPSDVSFHGLRGFLTVGLGGNPALRASLPAAGADLASLFRLGPGGGLTKLADLGAFEAANNPAKAQPGDEVDTNPNSVLAIGGREAVVADAGGNDVLQVNRRGKISLLGVIPFNTAPASQPVPAGTPVQSVPTSVARGPHGSYYVGQLTGFPFVPGAASVWRVKKGKAPKRVVSGLTQITDLAIGRDGNIYVVEISITSLASETPGPGALIRVTPNGKTETLASLVQPYGLALKGRFAYVTRNATSAGTGEVVRIPLPHTGKPHHGHR
jgi:hypothetical protein